MTTMHPRPAAPFRLGASDLRGAGRLLIDATTGLTDIVEAMHRNIASPPLLSPTTQQGRTRRITGLVYRSVRGVTRVVGGGIDVALTLAAPALGNVTDVPARDGLVSALNGVCGDHLAATANPLAITMQFRHDGRPLELTREALASALPAHSDRLILLVHGLCMNDRQWTAKRSDGSHHDHGAALQAATGATCIYLRYNSGRSIDENGAELAQFLKPLVAVWPVPLQSIAIIGHSMGGLVARSAVEHARVRRLAWRRKLHKLAFLGSPHLGAPLERGGHWIDVLLGAAPYAAPLARLGKLRSAGITDLRHGQIVAGGQPPLPKGVDCLAIAGRSAARPGGLGERVLGDGLVPVASALGESEDPARAPAFAPNRRVLLPSTGHLQLLASDAAFNALRDFLGERQ